MCSNELLEYLRGGHIGRDRAVKSAVLEHDLHISANELRRQVNRLRRKGVPIGSSKEGYFYAITAGEVYTTIRQLQEVAHGLDAAIAGLVSSLDHFEEEVKTPD